MKGSKGCSFKNQNKEKEIMKKTPKLKIILSVVLVTLLCTSFTKCLNNNVSETTTVTTFQESTVSETNESSIAETASVTETTPVETTIAETTVAETTIVETTVPETTTPETTPAATTAAPTTDPTTGETPVSKTVYTHGTVNIRTGPGTGYAKASSVPSGTALTVVAQTSNNWYRLSDNNYVSMSVVFDLAPTPIPTPTPSPTPDPNAPTPTPAEAGISQSKAKSIAKDVITSVRSANGFTTNYSDVLSGACQAAANRYIVSHTATNGTLESIADMGQSGYDSTTGWTRWSCRAHDGTMKYFDTSEEALRWIVEELVVNHVPEMASNSTFTEFGVGIAKEVKGAESMWQVNYYIYISCATPDELQGQIDAGWYS